jgi:hypothetical protein
MMKVAVLRLLVSLLKVAHKLENDGFHKTYVYPCLREATKTIKRSQYGQVPLPYGHADCVTLVQDLQEFHLIATAMCGTNSFGA